jgi:hypothetical protein
VISRGVVSILAVAMSACTLVAPAGAGWHLVRTPIEGHCIAAEFDPALDGRQNALPAAWWTAGASGDCLTRNSELGDAGGRITEGLGGELILDVEFDSDVGRSGVVISVNRGDVELVRLDAGDRLDRAVPFDP